MQLNRKLKACMSSAAESVTVDQVTIGIGYTAVTTSDGGIGIAATTLPQDGCHAGSIDFEDRPASDLLQLIMKPDPVGRTMALALINALNHRQAIRLPDDPSNTVLFDHFGMLSGARVAMVGYFPPLVHRLREKKIPLSVIDDAKGLGDKKTFYHQLTGWADVLLVTATSIINNTTESILSHAGPDLKTILLGPTTPMLPDAFDHLPIHMLAGSAISNSELALKVIRHGGGARSLKPASRKIYWLVNAGPRSD